jgi:hypothetical protein
MAAANLRKILILRMYPLRESHRARPEEATLGLRFTWSRFTLPSDCRFARAGLQPPARKVAMEGTSRYLAVAAMGQNGAVS